MDNGQTTYSFPILDDDEILACLRELEVDLDESELRNPTEEVMRRVYGGLVEILTGRTLEEIRRVDEEALATVDDPESIRADVPNFMFFMAIQELAIGCGLDDFGVDDIVEPDYKTAQRNLSALINFAKFREERLVEFEEALMARDAEYAELERARAENVHLKAELAAAQKEGFSQELADLEREVSEVSLDTEQIEAKAKEAENELHAALEEEKMLRRQLAELEAAHSDGGEDQQMAAANEDAEHSESLEEMQALEAELRESISIMQEIKKSREEHERMKAEYKKMQEEVAQQEEEIWKLDAKIEQLQRQEQSMDEKMARLKSQGKLKEEAALAALHAAQEELAAAQERVENQRAKDEENKKEIMAIEAHMKKMNDDHNRDMDALVRKYHELRDVVRDYHEQLFGVMEDMNTKGQRRERELAMAGTPNSSMLSTPPSAMSIDSMMRG
jgi:kinetochore protein Nuf2